MYSIIEAVLLSTSGQLWRKSPDPLLKAASEIVDWRLKHEFSWTHEVREEFWSILCDLFPGDMTPKGTINAALDSAVDYLSRITPVKVVFKAECLECQEDMGWYKYEFENVLEINTTNLKSVPNSLSDLVLAMIQRQMRKLLGPGGKRAQCQRCSSWGASVSEITTSNLAMPPVLFLGFQVKLRGLQTVKCKLEEILDFNFCEYKLAAAVVSKPMHFVAITRIRNKYYNLDNLDDSSGKKSFASFKSALIGKEIDRSETFDLSQRKPDSRNAGGIQYALYTGLANVGDAIEQFTDKATNLNDLANFEGLVPDMGLSLDKDAASIEEVRECSVYLDADTTGTKISEIEKKNSEPEKRVEIPDTNVNEAAVEVSTFCSVFLKNNLFFSLHLILLTELAQVATVGMLGGRMAT